MLDKINHNNDRTSICHVLPPDSADDWSHTTKVTGRPSKRFIASLKRNCFNLLTAFYQDLSATAVRSQLHHLMKSETNADKFTLQAGALGQSQRQNRSLLRKITARLSKSHHTAAGDACSNPAWSAWPHRPSCWVLRPSIIQIWSNKLWGEEPELNSCSKCCFLLT